MFTPEELKQLPEAISSPRFATYLQASENGTAEALKLYHWNLEISAAFMVPLQVCEVAVRNGVAEVIERVHGPDWPWSKGFIRSLPVPKKLHHYSPQSNLRAVAAQQSTVGRVVAELNFAFWEKVFTRGQDQRLWGPYLHQAFPGVSRSTTVSVARAQAYQDLFDIRRFRNRIAHHEPIFARDLAKDYARLRSLIYSRRPAAAVWVDKIERVSALIRTKP